MKLERLLESACATVDLSRLPLVVQTLKSINPSIEQTEEHLTLTEHVLKNSSGPLYIISDMTAMKWAPIKSIICLGKGMFHLDKTYPTRIQFHVFVNPTRIIRMSIPFFNLFARLEGHQICTDTKEEAIDWISLQTGIPFYE
ncbi:MAG: hypothetical protein ACI9UJ_001044 [bacterium]|jgi:hypothetical protein